MNHKQREHKRRKATQHRVSQYRKRIAAIREANEKVSKKKMADFMEKRGYVSNGRGGWRAIHKPKKIDKITKEA